MKAYSENKTVYISDFIKFKHKKRRVNSLKFSYLYLMHYVSTAERQIIKFSYSYVSNFNLSSMTKYKAIYISDFIKENHKKRKANQLKVYSYILFIM